MSCGCCQTDSRLTTQWRGIEMCDECIQFLRPRLDEINAAKAEAVLQFVLWLHANDITGRPDTLDAEDFINTQGWQGTGR